MPHAEDYAGFLNNVFHLHAIVNVCRHWFLTKYMISLFCERQNDIDMHLILNCNDYCISETFSNGPEGVSRSFMKILPRAEDQGFIYIMRSSKVLLSLWPRFSDSHYFAFGGFRKCKLGIILSVRNNWGVSESFLPGSLNVRFHAAHNL